MKEGDFEAALLLKALQLTPDDASRMMRPHSDDAGQEDSGRRRPSGEAAYQKELECGPRNCKNKEKPSWTQGIICLQAT